MASHFITQAQYRALEALGIELPTTYGHNNGYSLTAWGTTNSYRIAARLLVAAGAPASGLPANLTWQQAGKLPLPQLARLLR